MKTALKVVGRDHAPTLADRMQRGARGYAVNYVPGDVNRCPSCGGRRWTAGRVTAECWNCGLPLPISADGVSHQPTPPPSLLDRLRGL